MYLVLNKLVGETFFQIETIIEPISEITNVFHCHCKLENNGSFTLLNEKVINKVVKPLYLYGVGSEL